MSFYILSPLPTTSGGTGLTTIPTNGQLLIGNGTGYSLATLTAGANVTITNSAGGITIAASGGGGGGVSSVTGSGNIASSGGSTPNITFTGTLPVASGGTGVTASSGANSVVLRDASGNLTTNASFNGFTSVAASGSTITLTVASTPVYLVTGSGGQVIQLPDATTLPLGAIFSFNNNQSSGAITVNNNSGTLIASIPSGGYVTVVLNANASAAGTWDRHDQTPSNVSWSTNTLDYTGSITSSTWNGNAVAVNRGGTGQTTASTAFNALSPITSTGDLIIGNGTNSATRLGIGTVNYVLTSNGTTAVWSAAGGSMVYPGAGIPNSTGSAWGTSYTTSGSGTVVALATGATLTNPTITNYTETRYSATVTSNAITLDLANGTFQTITTMVGANAITLPAVASGKSLTVQILYASTPTTLTFASPSGSLKWPNSLTPTPTLTNAKYDFYTFVSDGTNWYGIQTGTNF
jgi:hypothetical protein